MIRTEEELSDRTRARIVTALVATSLGIGADRILGAYQSRPEAAARRIAMYVTRCAFGMSLSRVARAFGRDRSTIAIACRVLEDRRDDRDFDKWIGALERAATAIPAPAVTKESVS